MDKCRVYEDELKHDIDSMKEEPEFTYSQETEHRESLKDDLFYCLKPHEVLAEKQDRETEKAKVKAALERMFGLGHLLEKRV